MNTPTTAPALDAKALEAAREAYERNHGSLICAIRAYLAVLPALDARREAIALAIATAIAKRKGGNALAQDFMSDARREEADEVIAILALDPAAAGGDELRQIDAMLFEGQGDDDGEQILPSFEPGMSTVAKVEACLHLLERRRDAKASGMSAEQIIAEACKRWEFASGEPPDWDSPLHQVFVAGMSYTERLLAKLLNAAVLEAGDGSENFDNDATMSLQNILTAAKLYDPEGGERTALASRAPAGPADVEQLWRECGLPEYFLGNAGTNHRLYEFARRCASPAAGGTGSAEWLPIESAKDGKRYLATGGGLGDEVEVCTWNERVGCWNCETCTLDDTDHEADGYNRPLFCMPFPSPPLAAAPPAPVTGEPS